MSGRFAWLETVPPFAIITGAVCLMGGLQSLAQWATVGKPKATGVDHWDRQLDYRDRILKRDPDSFVQAWQLPSPQNS